MLLYSKTACESLFKCNNLCSVIGAPERFLDRVTQNGVQNNTKRSRVKSAIKMKETGDSQTIVEKDEATLKAKQLRKSILAARKTKRKGKARCRKATEGVTHNSKLMLSLGYDVKLTKEAGMEQSADEASDLDMLGLSSFLTNPPTDVETPATAFGDSQPSGNPSSDTRESQHVPRHQASSWRQIKASIKR